MISAAWGYSLLRDNVPSQSGEWRVAPLPSWTAGTASSGDWGGSTVAFLKGDKDLYEAVEFNLWLETNPQALALENSLGGLYPASTAGQSMPQLSQGVAYYGGQKIFDVFKQAASQINTSWTWGPTQDAADTSLQNALIAAVNGSGTLSGALTQAQTATINTMQSQAIPVEAAK
jgi:multiple sugar transport system substrate-binding protein